MAARARIQERRTLAIQRIQKDAAALGDSLGVDASALGTLVKGDPEYQEMIRTEQLADLLAAVREKVEAKPAPEPEVPPAPPEPSKAPQAEDPLAEFVPVRKATKTKTK